MGGGGGGPVIGGGEGGGSPTLGGGGGGAATGGGGAGGLDLRAPMRCGTSGPVTGRASAVVARKARIEASFILSFLEKSVKRDILRVELFRLLWYCLVHKIDQSALMGR